MSLDHCRVWRRLLVALALLGCGCAPFDWRPGPFAAQITQSNPALVTIQDPDYVWEQVVEVVDDYFKIVRQERVRVVGDVLTEGFVETAPTPGATLLEPWHRDSADTLERLESTLQTIRRRALVRQSPGFGPPAPALRSAAPPRRSSRRARARPGNPARQCRSHSAGP